MPRSKTPSFVTDIPLVVDSSTEKELLSRFQAGRQLYNACLGEAMVRMELVRESEAYQSARRLPKGKARNEAFSTARTAYRYSEYALHSVAKLTAGRSKWITEKLDANTQQTIATRAFKASERVLFGQARKVRHKVPTRFRSMEGKTNKQGIRWTGEGLTWGKLFIPGLIDPENEVMTHGLNSPIKYVRLLWREYNGRRLWYAQLVCEGLPYIKPQNYVSQGLIGLDLNVSNVAFVGNDYAGLLPFADKVPTFEKEIKAAQRQMERSRRVSNPNNYEPDFAAKQGRKTVKKKGKPKKGKRQWKQSNHYRRIARKKRNLERRKTAYAKSQNRQLVNEILRHGNQIQTERVSVKGWQKRYGKAIAAKSPGFFQSELIRKAASAGGSVSRFPTQTTALSQTHLTGERVKKSLSERVHHDQTGIVMHRDLFSAYLARYIVQDKLSLEDAVDQYSGMESALLGAWEQYQSAKRVGVAESPKSEPPVEQIPSDSEKVSQISQFGLKAC